MNRTTAILIGVIVLLVGTVAFLIGQRSDEEPAAIAPGETILASSNDDDDAAADAEPETLVAPKPLAVRIGRDGPHESACDRIGRVANLPGGTEDFLAVREAPTTDAKQIDKLDDDAPFYVCDRQGPWYGIVYLSGGTLPTDDRCGLENSVGSVQRYAGACLTGWVSS